MPRSLRWVLSFPAGIVAAVIVDSVLRSALDAAGFSASPDNAAGVSRAAVLALAWGFTLTSVPAMLSPRPWVVGLVMFGGGLLFRVAPIIFAMTVPYQRARLPSLAVALTAAIGAHVVGGAVGLYLIRHLNRPVASDDVSNMAP